MGESKPKLWREIAEAILGETDPEVLSTLVDDLCQALDSKAPEQDLK